MSYIVTITKTEEKTGVKGNDWVIVEKRPYTKVELLETGDQAYWGQKEKEIRGYTPEIKVTEPVERQIFRQVVDEMDMDTVIKAINGMD